MRTVLGSLFLLGFVALGLALAVNFRGITSEHAKRSVAMRGPVRSRFRPDLTPDEMRRRVDRATVLERIVGVVFALVGSAALVAAIIGGASQHR